MELQSTHLRDEDGHYPEAEARDWPDDYFMEVCADCGRLPVDHGEALELSPGQVIGGKHCGINAGHRLFKTILVKPITQEKAASEQTKLSIAVSALKAIAAHGEGGAEYEAVAALKRINE